MGSRTLLALALLVAVAISAAFFLFSAAFLRAEVGDLLPSAIALEIDQPLRMLLAGQTVALLILAVFLALGIFFSFAAFIAKPLKRLARALDAYAASGERIAIPGIAEAPKEIRSLAAAFDALINRVDESGKRDAEVSRVKSDFISTAAHQLRTPLTGIRWAHEALLKENLTENQRILVQSAVDKSKDLVAIVGTMLDISAIESGKYKYDFKPTDIRAVIDESVNGFAPLAASAKVSLFFARDNGGALPFVRADRERIKWVLDNLIDNAINYTPEGGTVRVSVEAAEHRIFVKVKDSGIGIPPESRSNIFERFYRAGNAISKRQSGSGLGLYIARTVATDHGGDLSFAANMEGPGTTFTLSLPTA